MHTQSTVFPRSASVGDGPKNCRWIGKVSFSLPMQTIGACHVRVCLNPDFPLNLILSAKIPEEPGFLKHPKIRPFSSFFFFYFEGGHGCQFWSFGNNTYTYNKSTLFGYNTRRVWIRIPGRPVWGMLFDYCGCKHS